MDGQRRQLGQHAVGIAQGRRWLRAYRVDAFGERAHCRAQGHVVVVPCAPGFLQHAEGIGQAVEGGARQYRFVLQCQQALAQGQQMASQVAAVHRGDVVRRQRLQGFGVVPVVEMAAMTRQLFHGPQRELGPLHDAAHLQIAKVIGREIGQQRQAYVGRRGAPRHHQQRMLLDVVRWQPMVLGADPGLKERPGAARQTAQERQLQTRQFSLALFWRSSHPRHQHRRAQPQRQDWGSDPQGKRVDPGQPRGDRERKHRRKPHAAQFRAVPAAQAAFDFAGRIPLQQMTTRDQHPPGGAADGAQAEERLVRQAGQVDRRPQQLPAARLQHLQQVGFQGHVHRLGEQVAQRRQQHRQQQQGQHPQGPGQHLRHQRPADHEQDRGRRRHQAAAQVVQQLAAREPRERIEFKAALRARYPWQQPRQQLPVTADPAVASLHVGRVARRVILEQAHVADQAGTRVAAFQQVMAQDLVLRETVLQRVLEGIDVVDALADERTFAKQVLVHVRHRACIRIDTRLAAIHARITRADAATHAGAHTGLQDAVATRDPALVFVEARLVERMGQGADELARGIARQPRVSVQGDHVAHVGQHADAAGNGKECGFAVCLVFAVPQQMVQRGQLATLALVAHPRVLSRVPETRTMEEEEEISAFRRIAGIETFDLAHGVFHQRLVARHFLLGCVQEIGQQAEMQVRIAIGQEAHLQSFDQGIDAGLTPDHARHDHQRARAGGDAFGVIHARQRLRRDQHGRRPVDQRNAQFTEGDQPQQPDDAQPAPVKTVGAGLGHQRPSEAQRDHADGQQVERQRNPARTQAYPLAGTVQRGHRGLSLGDAIVDQVIANMRCAIARAGIGPREGQHAVGDLHLAGTAEPGHLFHDMPVSVAGTEIHVGVGSGRIPAQYLVHQAHGFHELAPVHVGQEAQAADAVADGHLVGRLLLAFGVHQFLDAVPAVGHPLLDPVERHGQCGAAPVQASGQFGHERAGDRGAGAGHVGDDQHHVLGIALGGLVQQMGPVAGQPMVHSIAHHPHRHAPQVLDQGQPQHDGDGPQLTHLQGGDRLVGGHEPAQRFGVDAAVTMGDRLHGQVVDAWQARGFALVQRGQFAAVPLGKVATRGADLFLDQVIVVQQPFPGRGDADVVLHHAREQGAGIVEQAFIVLEARQQQVGLHQQMDLVLASQRLAVPFHLLCSQQVGTQGLLRQQGSLRG